MPLNDVLAITGIFFCFMITNRISKMAEQQVNGEACMIETLVSVEWCI